MSTDAAYRRFVSYIDRSREYYAAQGYDRPYRWARPEEAPALQPLAAPLAELRLAVVTSAFPLPPAGETAPVEVPYAQAVEPLPVGGFTADDNRDHSVAPANERESYLPLARLGELAAERRIGSLSPRFYGAPYAYSQRRTITGDAPAVLDLLRADGVGAALLAPHCPVCHQSLSLVARHLEANGVPTVLVGSARDIVEEIGVPRFLFVDVPLGYPFGRPGDAAQQRSVCAEALDLLERAWAPRTTVQATATWGDDSWRERYMRVDDTTRASLAQAGDRRRADQDEARATGRPLTAPSPTLMP
ncbi:MAG: glycine reductase [Acidimicrobiia bacterium]|nr:glycine reductase [Acidimicrobiia bacterium]MDH4364110.1 glycine reductase [Acidimicrobiia bacterium]